MEEIREPKKKRLSLACNVCRRKKIKCDGIKPTCGKCARFDIECSYTSNIKKRGPRQGHIELLEQRLKKMEELMTSAHNINNSVSEEGRSMTNMLPTTPLQPNGQQLGYQVIPQTAPPPPPPSAFANISAEHDRDGFPSDDIVEHLLDVFFRNCATVSPIADVKGFRVSVRNKTCNRFLLYCFMAAAARFSKRPDIVEQPLWTSGEKYGSKARDMIGKVIDQGSMEHIQGFLMLTLHEYGCGRGPRCWTYTGISIRMSIEVGLHKEAIFEEEPGTVLSLDRWYWYETRRKTFWDAFMHDKFASASTGRPHILDPNDCEIMIPVDFNALDVESGDDFYQCNVHQTKLVHYHILRDTITNEITGIQYNPLDLKLPEHRMYLNRIGWDSYIMQESVMLGKVTQLVNRGYKIEDGVYGPYQSNSEFEALDRELDTWADSLPHQIRNTPANLERFRLQNSEYRSAKFVLGHILHNSLVVLLNRPSLVIADMPGLGQVTQTVQDKVHKSMEKCLAAADNVTVMLKDLCCQIDVIPPFITYLVYTTATVMVNSSFSMNPIESQKARNSLNEFFRFLSEMKVYWAMADKLYFMIHDLYNVHQKVLEISQKDSSSSKSVTNTSSSSFDSSPPKMNSSNSTTIWNISPTQEQQPHQQQEGDCSNNNLVYAYPCLSTYCSSIPVRRLPMAEVSMSTSDWTENQNWDYNNHTYNTNNNNDDSNSGFLSSINGIRKKSLFTDSSISTFDLWIQQQQQQRP